MKINPKKVFTFDLKEKIDFLNAKALILKDIFQNIETDNKDELLEFALSIDEVISKIDNPKLDLLKHNLEELLKILAYKIENENHIETLKADISYLKYLKAKQEKKLIKSDAKSLLEKLNV